MCLVEHGGDVQDAAGKGTVAFDVAGHAVDEMGH